MSSKLVFKLADILRGTHSAEDAVVFIAQLLSWAKLSESKILPDEYSVMKIGDPITVSQLEKVFHFLTKSELLEENVQGFRLGLEAFRNISDAVATNLIYLIKQALVHNLIDYKESAKNLPYLLRTRFDVYNFVPDEVAELMVKLANITNQDEVYCPFDGSLKIAILAGSLTDVVCAEIRSNTPLPFLFNILMDCHLQTRISDPIHSPTWLEKGQLKKFDIVLASPPLGMQYNTEKIFELDFYDRFPEKSYYSDVLHIRHILAQTKRRAIVIVSNALLFRTAAGEKSLKVDLLTHQLLKTVISFPNFLLPIASVPFSIFMFDKEDAALNKLLFVDLSSENFFIPKNRQEKIGSERYKLTNLDTIVNLVSERKTTKYSYLADYQECVTNDYDLSVKRYVLSTKHKEITSLIKKGKSVKLSDIATITRAQAIPSVENGNSFFEVGNRDIELTGYIRTPNKTIFVDEKFLHQAENQKLQQGDILLCIKGQIGVVGIVSDDCGNNWIAGQSYVIIRLVENAYIDNPIVLYRYLKSPFGQLLVNANASGAAVSFIQIDSIKNLKILVSSGKEQQEIIKTHKKVVELYKQIELIENEIEVLNNLHWSTETTLNK